MNARQSPNAERNNGTVNLAAVRRVHLVGIAGAGLSAIAAVLLERGLEVSGSDLQPSAQTEALARRGARIFAGHAPDNVRGADLVIVSSAVSPSNPEWQEAARLGIPVVKRGPVLAALLGGKVGIAVAGSHGKTTTAGLIALLLSEAGLDPSFIIGGVVENFGANARAGSGLHFVLEADEYDRTFLALRPHVAIITNVEMDHPDCFRDEEDLRQAFLEFAAHTVPGGLILAWAEDLAVAALAQEAASIAGCAIQTFGFGPAATWSARNLKTHADGGTEFAVLREGRQVARARMALPGQHNVANGLAALAAVAWLGISPEAAAHPPVFARARAVARYDGGTARALANRLKYYDRLELAE
ncbi:MAG: Mur ligase family protein, partial [Anaerolineae bacterium]|nr:Mur ligase family protein [Anaerolineae bacterium]